MEMLIWAGALLTLTGIGGLGYCIFAALKMRRSGADEEAMRLGLKRVVLINVAALGVSALGLMLVIMGIVLG